MSRYDAVDDYVYPGTTVLRNKADLQGQAALDAFEADSRIEAYLGGVLAKLPAENWLRGVQPEPFLVRLAHYMGEINATHPFSDGNGRTQRVFCALLAEQAGYFIDFESVDQDQMYRVMIDSFNGNGLPLQALLLSITAIIGVDEACDGGSVDD